MEWTWEMPLLRSIHQGASAAGWVFKDLREGEGGWLPRQSLTFRRPGGRCGVVFAKPDRPVIGDILALSNHANVFGLRIVWLLDALPNLVPTPQKPMVQLVEEDVVVPPDGAAITVAEFVELALNGWMRFSEAKKRWVWSDPYEDPEALDPRIIQAMQRKELERSRAH